MSPAEDKQLNACTCGQILAVASIVKQPWMQPYDLETALKRGTIFDNLHFPFYAGGDKS